MAGALGANVSGGKLRPYGIGWQGWQQPQPVGGGGAGGGNLDRPAFNLDTGTYDSPRANYGGGGGGAAASINMPAAQPYGAYQGGMSPEMQSVSQYGTGLMQPGSEYFQRLSEQMRGQIGGQSAAAQRAAALRAAYSGFGAGGPESMQTAAELGQAGLGAAGQGMANLLLQAPQLGMQALQSTFAPYMGIQQLGEQSRQFGAGLGEEARQFGIGTGLQQQQLAANQALQQAQLSQQGSQANIDNMMRMLAMVMGGM